MQLGKTLSELDVLEAWCEAGPRLTRSNEAMEGRTPAGHKLVMKRAVRKWRDDRRRGDCAPRSVRHGRRRSVRQEAALARTGRKAARQIDRKAMADLVIKVSSGVTLAPESDKREAISPDAAAEFSTVEIEE
jgi:hypothetical protein